jgi:hypothetical protein
MVTATEKATVTARKRNNFQELARFRAGSFLQKRVGSFFVQIVKEYGLLSAFFIGIHIDFFERIK